MSACVALSAAAPNMPECMSVVAGAHAQVEVEHAAHADAERGLTARIIPPSRISAASRDRSSASTHFSIESPPTSSSPSKAKRTLTGSVPSSASCAHGLDEDEHVPLVVRDSARIQAAVPLRELERRRLPQVERIRRLHVEVRVAEDRRRGLGLFRTPRPRR